MLGPLLLLLSRNSAPKRPQAAITVTKRPAPSNPDTAMITTEHTAVSQFPAAESTQMEPWNVPWLGAPLQDLEEVCCSLVASFPCCLFPERG